MSDDAVSGHAAEFAAVKRLVLQIRFDDQAAERHPVAASAKRRGSGPRVTVEVEREAVVAKSIFVLYRIGAAGVVIAGSAYRERVETALANLGKAGAAYRIVRIPLEDGGAADAFG